jgi:hypothetical protein
VINSLFIKLIEKESGPTLIMNIMKIITIVLNNSHFF